MPARQYALSTHLFHDQRLARRHLQEAAAHGFGAIELFATRTHFDYHDAAAVAALGEWLRETGLALLSAWTSATRSSRAIWSMPSRRRRATS